MASGMHSWLNAVEETKETERRYANYLEVGQNTFEFLFNFGQSYSSDSSPILHTTIVTSPAFAKRFLELFSSAVQEYEEVHGVIPL